MRLKLRNGRDHRTASNYPATPFCTVWPWVPKLTVETGDQPQQGGAGMHDAHSLYTSTTHHRTFIESLSHRTNLCITLRRDTIIYDQNFTLEPYVWRNRKFVRPCARTRQPLSSERPVWLNWTRRQRLRGWGEGRYQMFCILTVISLQERVPRAVFSQFSP